MTTTLAPLTTRISKYNSTFPGAAPKNIVTFTLLPHVKAISKSCRLSSTYTRSVSLLPHSTAHLLQATSISGLVRLSLQFPGLVLLLLCAPQCTENSPRCSKADHATLLLKPSVLSYPLQPFLPTPRFSLTLLFPFVRCISHWLQLTVSFYRSTAI